MKSLIYLSLLIFFSLLSSTVTNFNLVLLLVISYGINSPSLVSLIMAFLSGVIFDLIKAGNLGLTSLFFLFISFIISLYRQRFIQRHFFYSLTFTFLVYCFYHYLKWKKIFFIQSLFLASFSIPLNLLITLVKEKLGETPHLKI